MHFFKRTAPSPISIDVSTPDSVSHDDVFLDVEVILSSTTQTVKPTVKARLRADLTDKKKARGAAQFYLLGEADYQGAVSVVPEQPEKLSIRIPLDFSTMSAFDIPAENIAMASPEMQAAMKAAQEINHLYAYSVEAVVKLENAEYTGKKSIELIHPDSTRVSNF